MCSQEQANFSSPTPTKTTKVVTSNMKSVPSSARQSNGFFSPCHSTSSHSTRSTYHSCSDDDTVNTFATESVGADELTNEIEEMQDVLSTLRMALHGFNPVKITSLPSPTPSVPSKTVSSLTELLESQQREVEELAAQQETEGSAKIDQDPRTRTVKSWEFLSLQNVDELEVEEEEESEQQEETETTDEPHQQESAVSQDKQARMAKSWDFLSIQNIGELDVQDETDVKDIESRTSDTGNSAVGSRTSTRKAGRKPRHHDNDPLGRHSDRPCPRTSAQRTPNRHRVTDLLGRHSDRPCIRSSALKPSRPKVTDPLGRHTDRPTIRKSAQTKKSSRSRNNQDPDAIGRHSDRPCRSSSRHDKDVTDGSSKKKKSSRDILNLMDSVTSLFSDDTENNLFLDDDVLQERRRRMLEQQRRHKAALREEEQKIRSRLDMLKAKKAARLARAANKKK